MNTFIGIDLGTSSVKLLLAKANGNILKTVSERYPVFYPQAGYSEQNPLDWTNAVVAGLKKLLDGTEPLKVRGISFAGQMHGLVALDENDMPVRPAILWNDSRAHEETAWLNETIGRDKLVALTANVAFAGFTAPKILWIKKHEPENFKRIKKIMLPKDYIALFLSGRFSTDVSDASGTLLFDVKNRRWSEEMCAICGVKKEWLPLVSESAACCGLIKKEIAKQFNLNEDVKIIAGAADNAAAAVGVGAVGSGGCNVSIGTSGTVFVSTDKFIPALNNAVHVFCHADGGWHQMGCMLSAALCGDWWAANVLNSAIENEQTGAECFLGSNNVFFLPYLMGERSPHNDTNAKGAFIGLSPLTTRAQMTLSVLEGVSFGLKDSFEAIKNSGLVIEKTRVCGGGAKSGLWRKILSNVCNTAVETPDAEEGAALGAAILAMVGCGEYSCVREAARKIVKIKGTMNPEKPLAKSYAERYTVFTKLYPALKEAFKTI